ncbi:MAG TPA: mechanosensitive ion channel domain-containing protein [Thermoleophilaceae bacterium]|nr:mechanosensitive ion channel domain-containing protein [Thermoleophilaceae bacterium]
MDGDVVTAIVTVVVAIAIAEIVDRMLARRGKSITEGLSPVANTRLRMVRRLVFAAIVLIGAMLALSQFEEAKRVATGVLASSAVLGLVVGFAARQTLANGIAGILLAITQPIRIGDLVTFEGESGTVEDIRLSYTFIRKANDTRLVVPNERLAQSPIENHTIVDPRVRVEVELWLPPEADAVRALAVVGGPDVDVEIAQVDKDGVKLVAATWADTARERGKVAARVRAAALESLRSEGLAFTPE